MAPNRYHRQTLLPGWGDAGQQRLAGSRAAIVGVGALGCAAADLLARAGVGHITLIDRDIVELTNLQRQSLFTERDAAEATPKAEAAAQRLRAVNSEVTIVPVVADLDAVNAERLLAGASIIIDGLDNYDARFLLNDISVKHGIPYIYAGAIGTRGMVMPVLPALEGAPCLRCLFAGPPPAGSQPTCDSAGVLGPLISIIAGHQAALALRVLLALATPADAALLEIDPWRPSHRRVEPGAGKDRACPCCGSRRFDFLDAAATPATVLCGADAVQVAAPAGAALALDRLSDRLASVGTVRRSPFHVRVTVDGSTLTIFPDGRAIVHGVTDPGRARAIYARVVGV